MSWQPINLGADEYAIPAAPPTLAGLIYPGRRHLISGPPESAKTVFSYIVALEHLRAGGRVALIDLEMGPTAARGLLDELGATADELVGIYYVEPTGPPATADLDELRAAGVTLAIIDAAAGAYGVSGLDDNKRQDAERFARTWVDPLWQAGVTTILVDHVTKNSETRGKFAIGSERKAGGADVHLGLHAVRSLHRGASGLIRVDTHKDRPGHLTRPYAAELHLSSDTATHRIAWTFQEPSGTTPGTTGNDWRPTVLIDRVRAYLNEHPEPISRSALADAVTGNRTYLLRAIDALLKDNELAHHGRKLVPRNVPGTRNVP